ncbi:MAG: dihydroorotate dehydrogenase electron transfer subunit [Candidatus Omnitrophica bacterium]|nr:dihydroorotate dehydrogenase electron transfer subunit [Candidatus Omnitrophota bacterium]
MKNIQGVYKVAGLTRVNDIYYRLALEAPELARLVKPGQFIHIKVSAGLEPLFRRPFSVYRAVGGKVEIFFEPVGKGSRLLAGCKKGDLLDVLGPLGRPFSLPSRDVRQVVFIAGGVGVAPFMLFSDQIVKHKAAKVLLYGGRSKAHTFPLNEFKKNAVKAFVATDDGSAGVPGRVSELFGRIDIAPTTFIYACGPRPMLAAVAAFAREKGLKGEASMEEVMACGLGACLGCSIPTSQGYQTVCHDGPVFDLQDLVFP